MIVYALMLKGLAQRQLNSVTSFKNKRLSLFIIFVSLTLIWLILPQAVCPGATSYVDVNSGDDNNDGQSPGNAWKTIAKVNSQTPAPGDSVLFKRGELWREQLTVPSSGDTSASITFGAYGTGEKPEINGADVITGWSLYKGNIYVADVNSEVTQLFIDGERQTRARWPDNGWQEIDANSSNKTSLFSNSLTQPDNYWAGADIVVKTKVWNIEIKKVVANSGNTIIWNSDVSYAPEKNFGFYLEGKLEEIDTPGEWCYSGGKVYLYVTGGDRPDNHLIEGSVRSNGIKLSSRQHINIENIAIKYTSEDGVYIKDCDYINLKDNVILFSGSNGIFASGYPLLSHGHIYIRGNIFGRTRENGIRKWGMSHGEITNNEFTDIASFETSPRQGSAIRDTEGANVVISGNRIDRVCYHGISAGLENAVVSNNVIANCLLLLSDGGGVYTWGSYSKNISITHNIVSNCVGNTAGTPYSKPSSVCGIYLDAHTSGMAVKSNIVSGCGYGILLHETYDNIVVNNVLYNNDTALRLSESSVRQGYMHDNKCYNNIFLAANAEQITLYASSSYSPTDLIEEYDYNIHYNPQRKDVIRYQQPGINRLYTLEEWQAFSDQDARSIGEDPLLVGPSDADFHLKSISPCIDSGMDMGLTEDFDGNPIPQGAAPDIGAYEFRK